jgi:hypothetical protein
MLYKFAEVGNLVCGDSCLRQLSEMLARGGPNKASSSTSLVPSPVVQRKSSIVDWVSIRPRALTQEEKQHWVCIFYPVEG